MPFDYQTEKGEWVGCKTKEDVIQCIIDDWQIETEKRKNPPKSYDFFRTILLKVNSRLFYDQDIIDMIVRYNYCSDFNCPAFPGSFDEQPAVWVDFVNLIKGEVPKIMESARG